MSFHPGEVAVQSRAGVAVEARRLVSMLDPGPLSSGAIVFLAAQQLLVVTALDAHGRLWTSMLTGEPEFLAGSGATLRVNALPDALDPLHDLGAGGHVGALVLDAPRRRRLRVNGTVQSRDETGLTISVSESYGNCPQYITARPALPVSAVATRVVEEGLRSPTVRSVVQQADTFFLGTRRQEDLDASHRGGPPGFVRVEGNRLWWDDFPGNNMFNSLGNLELDASASLLLTDYSENSRVQMTGEARLLWDVSSSATGRRVEFLPSMVLRTTGG